MKSNNIIVRSKSGKLSLFNLKLFKQTVNTAKGKSSTNNKNSDNKSMFKFRNN